MPCAGSEGFLVMREEHAKRLGMPYARILGTIERHNAFAGRPDPVSRRLGGRSAIISTRRPGFGPPDIDVLEVYDDYPVINCLQFEGLGFCREGDAPAFIRRTSFTVDGSLPTNTSGGQLSVGQAGAAGGFLGMVQALRQVTGQAMKTQVENARHALVSGFGMINYDRGICTGAAILGRA